jgi:hypothetical protein
MTEPRPEELCANCQHPQTSHPRGCRRLVQRSVSVRSRCVCRGYATKEQIAALRELRLRTDSQVERAWPGLAQSMKRVLAAFPEEPSHAH